MVTVAGIEKGNVPACPAVGDCARERGGVSWSSISCCKCQLTHAMASLHP